MEIWKPVKGYEKYYSVSNLGNVKSLQRITMHMGGIRTKKEKILKPSINKNGYKTVGLCVNNKRITNYIHTLVCESFLNHERNGFNIVVNHIDNNKLNNNLDNLELVTNRYNSSVHRKGTSKYTGVYWNKALCKWHSQIRIKGKSNHLGYFINEMKASQAYKEALNNLQKKTA